MIDQVLVPSGNDLSTKQLYALAAREAVFVVEQTQRIRTSTVGLSCRLHLIAWDTTTLEVAAYLRC